MKNIIYDSIGFDWDEHNLDKNWYRHQVTNEECEEVFFNTPIIMNADKKHSKREVCYALLGRTDRNRRLFVAFTVHNHLIRVISARDMNEREIKRYDKEF